MERNMIEIKNNGKLVFKFDCKLWNENYIVNYSYDSLRFEIPLSKLNLFKQRIWFAGKGLMFPDNYPNGQNPLLSSDDFF